MNKNLIYDIGMHNGDDTAYYLSLGYHVISIDASPELVIDGNKRFENEVKKKQVEILNIGIAESEGTCDFYLNRKNSVWNSFSKEIGTREGMDCEVIKVKTTSLDKILQEKGVPYYMKIDIEGNDILCLQSLLKCPEKPWYISVEVSSIELILKLRELGYSKFKIIDQSCFLPLQLPELKEYRAYRLEHGFRTSMNIIVRIIRKLFGRMINRYLGKKYKHFFKYDHPHGSSGPFAEGLPGRWVDFDEALLIYLYYGFKHRSSKVNKGYNYWIDIHASR